MVITDAGSSGLKEEIPHDHLFMVTGLSSSNLEKLATVPDAADFETAIAATGYGRFNVVLMLCTLPAFWSAVSVTSAVSYIFARSQCDMNLTLVDMGTINAMTYGGMISSAMIWGFLSDTLGRRNIMVWGFLGSGIIEIMSAMSQNLPMLLVSKFTSGFLFNGPFAVLLSYLAELHRAEYRAKMMLLSSLFYTITNTVLPMVAWAILRNDWRLYLGDNFVFYSWNVFLLVTAFVPLLTGMAFFYLPESPKFLMSRGRNDEALNIFRHIYAMNTGKSPNDFPIQALQEEKSVQSKSGIAAVRGGWEQLKPLFLPPHGTWLLFICAIHACCMFGSNTIRLWYPQLAAMISSNTEDSLCAAIAPRTISVDSEPCIPLETDVMTYLQNALVGAGSVISYGLGGILVNRCGKKKVASFCSICSGVMIITLPILGSSELAVALLVTVMLAFTSLSSALLSSINVDLFPTSLRAMAMATFLMCGRFGTVTGTVTFPALITYGCLPPFITIATVLGLCGVASLFLPNTTLKKLE